MKHFRWLLKKRQPSRATTIILGHSASWKLSRHPCSQRKIKVEAYCFEVISKDNKTFSDLHSLSLTGSKMSPRPSLIPDLSELQSMQALSPEHTEPESTTTTPNQNHERNEPKTTANRASSCRVCLKSFKPDDFSKTCFECKYRVCEDCASYSKVDSAEDLVSYNLQ